MRHLLPTPVELFAFACVALLCALIVWRSGVHDLGMALASMPIFITAAVLGMRRNEKKRERGS